ncbi:hypothetical protein O3M35_008324 [Rhynocoris fuscipes]|uniref:Uncharacterized protein n=1 Tax=Rhynocoris fuscipes TaxID=488301 RepID=A0AAW1D7B7_9HEMI
MERSQRRTLSVAMNTAGSNNSSSGSGSEDDVRSTTASAEALAPKPVPRASTSSIPARFHYLADQPLEITNSLKGYNYPVKYIL